MKGKFMNFKEMAITQNTGMCSYLTIAWAVPIVSNILYSYSVGQMLHLNILVAWQIHRGDPRHIVSRD